MSSRMHAGVRLDLAPFPRRRSALRIVMPRSPSYPRRRLVAVWLAVMLSLGSQRSRAGVIPPECATDSSSHPAVIDLPDGGFLIDPVITVKAMSTGSAVAGPYTRGGVALTTSPAALKAEQAHSKLYDGPTEFKADYTIVLKADKTVDSSKSMVTFLTQNFTEGGKLVKSKFTTTPITITDVTLTGGDPTMIESFKFSSTDWYPNNATGAAGLMDRTLAGSIDLKAGTSSYKASYAIRSNGAIYTYAVDGTIPAPAPNPDPQPDDFGIPEDFSPLPEPSPEPATWIAMLGGLAGIAYVRRRDAGRVARA